MKYIFKFIWWLIGWEIIGDVPENQKKYIIIVAPHSSNWDFSIGVLVRGIMGFNSKYLGKKSLFKPPIGWFFKMMGGYPVDRSKNTNLVDEVVKIYNTHDEFVIALAPEGTRKHVEQWKTGFYYIALKASIPIIRIKFDHQKKKVIFFEPFWPTGNINDDMVELKKIYQDVILPKA